VTVDRHRLEQSHASGQPRSDRGAAGAAGSIRRRCDKALAGPVGAADSASHDDGTDLLLGDVGPIERRVVYAYPRTGRSGEAPLVEDWDLIPGARGCTPESCGFRDRHAELARAGADVVGLSTQDTAYERDASTSRSLSSQMRNAFKKVLRALAADSNRAVRSRHGLRGHAGRPRRAVPRRPQSARRGRA
jgi:peroxiredoxin